MDSRKKEALRIRYRQALADLDHEALLEIFHLAHISPEVEQVLLEMEEHLAEEEEKHFPERQKQI